MGGGFFNPLDGAIGGGGVFSSQAKRSEVVVNGEREVDREMFDTNNATYLDWTQKDQIMFEPARSIPIF